MKVFIVIAILAMAVSVSAAPYNPDGKIDPFKPLVYENVITNNTLVVKNPHVYKSYLETLDLSQLKLTALLFTDEDDMALVEEASTKGHLIGIGDYIGLNSGVVIDITNSSIFVEEIYEDAYGKEVIINKEIKLIK